MKGLVPKSYKHPANPVAVLEIAGAKPRCSAAVGSGNPGREFSFNRRHSSAAKKGTTDVSSLAALTADDCTTDQAQKWEGVPPPKPSARSPRGRSAWVLKNKTHAPHFPAYCRCSPVKARPSGRAPRGLDRLRAGEQPYSSGSASSSARSRSSITRAARSSFAGCVARWIACNCFTATCV
jgi:hypothetical protein